MPKDPYADIWEHEENVRRDPKRYYGKPTRGPGTPASPTQTTFGGSVGDVEREFEHNHGYVPKMQKAIRTMRKQIVKHDRANTHRHQPSGKVTMPFDFHGVSGVSHSHGAGGEGSSPPKRHTHDRGEHYAGKMPTYSVDSTNRPIKKGDPANVGYPPAPLSGGNGSGPKHGHSSKDRSLPEGSRGIVFSHEHGGGETPHHHQATTNPTYHSPYTTGGPKDSAPMSSYGQGAYKMKKASENDSFWRRKTFESMRNPISSTEPHSGFHGHARTKAPGNYTHDHAQAGHDPNDSRTAWPKKARHLQHMDKAREKAWQHKPSNDHWHPHNPDTGTKDVQHSHPTATSTQVPGSPPVQASHPYTGTARSVHPFGKAVQKGLKGPILEEGKKTNGKYTEEAPYAQAFNADNLTKRALRLSYGPVFDNLRSVIKKAGENVPGNLNEHLKRAHAAIHGREMFNPKYKELCQTVAAARKILTALEGELEEAEQQKEGMDGMGVPENKAFDKPSYNPFMSDPNKHSHGSLPSDIHSHKGGTGTHTHALATNPAYHSGLTSHTHPEGRNGEHGHPPKFHKAWAPGERNAYERRTREIDHDKKFGKPADTAPNLPPHDNLKHWNNAGVDHTHYKGTPSAIRHTHGPTSADRAAATKDQDGALKAAVSSYPAPKKGDPTADWHMRNIARRNATMNDTFRSIMGAGDLHEHRGQGSHSHPDAWTKHTHQNRYS